jgi:hypothetical protein
MGVRFSLRSLPHLLLVLALCGASATAARGAARVSRDLSFGVIKSVRCRGRRLDMNLKTSDGALHLYSTNYSKVDFTAANFTPKGKLNPCKEITGMKAKTIFYDVPRHADEGELISVELTRPDRQ